jgi:structure-specific endonuclease subunit SLX1
MSTRCPTFPSNDQAVSEPPSPPPPPSQPPSPYVAYLLNSPSSGRTYTGITTDLPRRLRQHNGALAGGAKATRGNRPWVCVATVDGFATKGAALRFESAWKRQRVRNRKGSYLRRLDAMYIALALHRQTATASASASASASTVENPASSLLSATIHS